MSKILLVEDEESIRKFTRINLERDGFEVIEAETGEIGIEKFKEHSPSVIILDIMLPGIDGYEVCKRIREDDKKVGIIMLTAKTQDVDKIIGLESGTDDYMIKPFNPKELVLRIQSLVRRMDMTDTKDDVINFGPFKFDRYSRTFTKNDEVVELTPTELSLVNLFISNPGKAFSRDELLNKTWGEDYIGDTKIVDVNIRRIRSKIENEPSNPEYLETVWGIGYRWTER